MIDKFKLCNKCGHTKPTRLFMTNGTRCKSCHAEIVKQKSRKKTQEVIDLLGGECKECGIKHDGVNTSIFDFHHVNPEEKEYSVSNLRFGPIEKMIKEAEKCLLLCSNCHRLLHDRERLSKF